MGNMPRGGFKKAGFPGFQNMLMPPNVMNPFKKKFMAPGINKKMMMPPFNPYLRIF